MNRIFPTFWTFKFNSAWKYWNACLILMFCHAPKYRIILSQCDNVVKQTESNIQIKCFVMLKSDFMMSEIVNIPEIMKFDYTVWAPKSWIKSSNSANSESRSSNRVLHVPNTPWSDVPNTSLVSKILNTNILNCLWCPKTLNQLF